MHVEARELLFRLVGIPSPSGEEGEAAAYLRDWMGAHGLDAEVDGAGNAVGSKGTGEKEILFLGHIDTVPGTLPVRLEGDLLYGRGAVDAKGPLCAFAAAAASADVPPGWKVTVVGAVEEEAATSRGARFVIQRRRDEGALPPVCCVIGEPSRWDRITIGYRGRLLAELKLACPLAHSAGPEKLPPERAVDLWLAVREFCDVFNGTIQAQGAFDRLDPTLRRFASRDDGAFGTVELGLGFRLPLNLDPDALKADLENLVARSGIPEISCRFHGAERACMAGKSNPLVRAFLSAIRDEGGAPRFVKKTGTSDMNVAAPAWPDTPIVAYGPGDSRLDHTPEEHIDLEEYFRSIRILSGVLKGDVSLFPRNPPQNR
jgi:LysW-gamma-L-lysine carboxypeptidase